MLPFAGNFGKDRKFSHTEWFCSCGEEREEEAHLLAGTCRVYGDLRRKYGDMENDEDLVSFFNEVLERKEEIGTRELNDQVLEVEQDTSDEGSPGDLPGRQCGDLVYS